MLLPPALATLQPPVPAVPGPQAAAPATPDRDGAASFARELQAARQREDGAADGHAAKAPGAAKPAAGPGASPATQPATHPATHPARGAAAARPPVTSPDAGSHGPQEPTRDDAAATATAQPGGRGTRTGLRGGAGRSGAAEVATGQPDTTDSADPPGSTRPGAKGKRTLEPADPNAEPPVRPGPPAPLPPAAAAVPEAAALAPALPADTGSAALPSNPDDRPDALPGAAAAADASSGTAAAAAAAAARSAALEASTAGPAATRSAAPNPAGGLAAAVGAAATQPAAAVDTMAAAPSPAAADRLRPDAAVAAAADTASTAAAIGAPIARTAVTPERPVSAEPALCALSPADTRAADAAGTTAIATAGAATERDGRAGALEQAGPAWPSFAAELAQRVSGPAAAETAPPLEMQAPVPVDAPDFLPRLGGALAILARDGVQEARVQLHPVELGPIAVQITLEGQAAQVHLAVDNAHTRALLESAMPTLAAALREQGLTLTGGGVFEQSRQGTGGQGDATPGRPAGPPSDGGAAPAPDTPQPARGARRAGALDLYA